MMNFLESGQTQSSPSIDISSDEKLNYWASRLGCTVQDLLYAVRQIGTNYTLVDTFLELNRKKCHRTDEV